MDPPPAAAGPGCSRPVPCGCKQSRYRLRPALSPRVGWTNPCIPKGYTARSHHPRAVEHRDCPPCGGGALLSHEGWWWGMAEYVRPTADCAGCFVKRWFWRVLSPNRVGGFCGIWRELTAVILGLDPRIFLVSRRTPPSRQSKILGSSPRMTVNVSGIREHAHGSFSGLSRESWFGHHGDQLIVPHIIQPGSSAQGRG